MKTRKHILSILVVGIFVSLTILSVSARYTIGKVQYIQNNSTSTVTNCYAVVPNPDPSIEHQIKGLYWEDYDGNGIEESYWEFSIWSTTGASVYVARGHSSNRLCELVGYSTY